MGWLVLCGWLWMDRFVFVEGFFFSFWGDYCCIYSVLTFPLFRKRKLHYTYIQTYSLPSYLLVLDLFGARASVGVIMYSDIKNGYGMGTRYMYPLCSSYDFPNREWDSGRRHVEGYRFKHHWCGRGLVRGSTYPVGDVVCTQSLTYLYWLGADFQWMFI